MSEALKVGELASRTGLTVRTLHHYDEIGLLRPSLHTGSGHRLYTGGDVARLQQIVSLRQLGFSLEQVRACLDRSDFSPLEVIRLHVARLREQIALQQGLVERLTGLERLFETAGEVSAEQFLQTIEVMTMIENYYTPEQLAQLQQRSKEVGEERIKQGQADWAELFAKLKIEMDNGTDPADAKVQALVKWQHQLVNEFTGGDPAIAASLKRMWTEQGDKLSAQMGYDPRLMEYLAKANEAAKGSA
jgi:DNA-binding transcriptional MerR regulator